jgi:crotonobetainyl-CoA:carnitine CoA-transferase CaiB-like acyl-CoA transferase
MEQPAAASALVEQPYGLGELRVPGLPFRMSDVPAPRPAPAAGQHTDEVLAELGLDAVEIRSLRDDGAVA